MRLGSPNIEGAIPDEHDAVPLGVGVDAAQGVLENLDLVLAGSVDVRATDELEVLQQIGFDEAYQKNLKKLSPKATYTFNELDFATGVPQQAGNIYKANPGTNFMTSDLGDFFIGVPQGLTQVGAKPGTAPMIGGLTAGKDAIQTLKNKTTNAWTAYSLPIVGYSVIDSFARYFTKLPFAKADLPTQILTQQNIGSAVLTPQGDYLGVKDFEAQFKKVWGVK